MKLGWRMVLQPRIDYINLFWCTLMEKKFRWLVSNEWLQFDIGPAFGELRLWLSSFGWFKKLEWHWAIVSLLMLCMWWLKRFTSVFAAKCWQLCVDNRLQSEYRFSLNLLVDLMWCLTLQTVGGLAVTGINPSLSDCPLILPSSSLSPILLFVGTKW